MRTVLTCMLLLVLLPACGYKFAGQGPTALPESTRKLYIAEVENPTMETWLGPQLRSLFRDEMTRRGWTRWVDREDAEGLVYIVVHRFVRSSSLVGEAETTLRSSSDIALSAAITDRRTGEVVWSSQQVSVSERYDTPDPDLADKMVTDLAIRRLVDQLSQGY